MLLFLSLSYVIYILLCSILWLVLFLFGGHMLTKGAFKIILFIVLKYSWFTVFQYIAKWFRHTYTHILFQILFNDRLLQDIKNSCLCSVSAVVVQAFCFFLCILISIRRVCLSYSLVMILPVKESHLSLFSIIYTSQLYCHLISVRLIFYLLPQVNFCYTVFAMAFVSYVFFNVLKIIFHCKCNTCSIFVIENLQNT